ncbi:MAG: hypothetical protein U0Q22_15240 [Acidimicrobiales bacterium]
MQFDETTRQVIARAIRERRASLGLSQEETAARSGGMVSTANLRVFEGAGRPTYRGKSLVGVARALGWPDDAIERIASGEDPAGLSAAGRAPASGPSTDAVTAPAVGGVELATADQVAALRGELADQQRVLEELARRVAQLVDATTELRRAADTGRTAEGRGSGRRNVTPPRVTSTDD